MSEPGPSTRKSDPISQDLPDDVVQALGLDASRRWRPLLVAGLLVLGVGVAFGYRAWGGDSAPVTRWRTATVERGDLTVVVRATGTLQPVDTVQVGAEVSGRVECVNVEPNDPITRGQQLASLETETYENALAQAEAQLHVAQAAVAREQANLTQAQAEEARVLGLKQVVSEQALVSAQAARMRAEADLRAAKAQVDLAQSRVDLSRTNLSKAVIRSPIEGVVLVRNVEPGNTIVASFQAPELFTLATALDAMQLSVDVDEADVGKVAPGQLATFSVDAWPGRVFPATVVRVSLAPTVADNVVTYETLLSVDNSAALLRPGMTGAATVVTGTLSDCSLVPNAALRFHPPQEDAGGFRLRPGPPGPRQRNHASGGAVWVLREGVPTRRAVSTGPTDGEHTQLLSGLEVGDEVIVGTDTQDTP